MRTIGIFVICITLGAATIPTVGAEELPRDLEDWEKPIGGEFARGLSDGTKPLIGATLGNYLLGDSYEQETAKRMMDALIVSGVGTQILKEVTKERRPIPHHVNDRGFPSGHAAVSFAAARVVAERDEGLEVPAYALAGLIGWSRHKTRQHHWDQIIAGAVLGFWAGGQAADGKFHLLADKQGPHAESFCFTGQDSSAEISSQWMLYRTEF